MRDMPADATGRQIALRLQEALPERDWMAKLAERSGFSRETVEWHLQEDMSPPAHIFEAAQALLAEAVERPPHVETRTWKGAP